MQVRKYLHPKLFLNFATQLKCQGGSVADSTSTTVGTCTSGNSTSLDGCNSGSSDGLADACTHGDSANITCENGGTAGSQATGQCESGLGVDGTTNRLCNAGNNATDSGSSCISTGTTAIQF